MKKKLLPLLLCLCMALSLLPAGALADAPQDISSSGLDLSTNAPTDPTTYKAGDTGTVVWDPTASPATLTFNDATVSVSGDSSGIRAFNLPADQAVKVIFNGTNSISANGSDHSGVAFGCNNTTTFECSANSSTTLKATAQCSYTINLSSDASAEITGSGELNIEAYGGDGGPFAIYADCTPVKLTGSTLSANAPIAGDVTLGGVTIPKSAELNLQYANSVTKGTSDAVITGKLILKDGTGLDAINALGLTGNGIVQADGNFYRYNGSAWQQAVPNTGLDLSTSTPNAETTWLTSTGTVTFTPATVDPAAHAKLVFSGATISATTAAGGNDVTAVTLPNAEIDVIFKGENNIDAVVQGNGNAMTFFAKNNVTFTAEAGSKTTLNAKGSSAKALCSDGGDVTINGEGELLLAPAVNDEQQKLYGYAIHAPSCTVTIESGNVYEKRITTDSATNVKSGTGGILAGTVNLNANTIPVGGMLDLHGADSITRGSGALLNDGTLILPNGTAQTELNGMNITGSGIVRIGEDAYSYRSGKWMVDITQTGLDLNNAPATETTYAAGAGTVVYTPGENGGVPTLTLNNATIAPLLQESTQKYAPPLVLGSAKIVLNGSSYLKGTGVPALCGADGSSAGNITVGGSGSLRLDGKSESLDSFGAANLTLEDTATVTSASGTVGTVNVADGAKLNAILKVDGRRTVYGSNTIPESVLRDYQKDNLKWMPGASMEVNGVMTLKKDTSFDAIKDKLTGSGIVRIVTETDDNDNAVAWNSFRAKDGTQIPANTHRLYFDLPETNPGANWKSSATLAEDGYTFTGNATDGYVLTLGNLDLYIQDSAAPALRLPGNGKVEVILAGDTRIQNTGTAMLFINGEQPCTIGGSGSLRLTSDYGNALETQQGRELTITGGSITACILSTAKLYNAFLNAPLFGEGCAPQVVAGTSPTESAPVDNPTGETYTKNKYVKLVVEYKVKFEANGGVIMDDVTELVTSGAKLEALPGVTRNGNTFVGWFLDDLADDDLTDGEIPQLTTDYMFTAGATAYAHWVPVRESHNDTSSAIGYIASVYNAERTIWLTGGQFEQSESLVTERNPVGSEYDALRLLAGDNEVFNTYNIYFRSGAKSSGCAMYLNFDLDAKYTGQTFTLAHQKADKAYEYFAATANANGDLTFGPLYELSPFMLVVGKLDGQTPVTVSAADIPQTGDAGTSAGLVMLAAAALAAYVAWQSRDKRRA